jgi:hypothetical protein
MAETLTAKVTDCPGWDGLAEEVSAMDALPCPTTWVSVVEVAVVKLLSPPYEAVILWEPCVSALVENVATPPESGVAPNWVAGVVLPSAKVTVPVAVPVAGAVAETTAIKVTDSPACDGLADEINTTAALPWLTTCAKAVEVALVKLVSPE